MHPFPTQGSWGSAERAAGARGGCGSAAGRRVLALKASSAAACPRADGCRLARSVLKACCGLAEAWCSLKISKSKHCLSLRFVVSQEQTFQFKNQ